MVKEIENNIQQIIGLCKQHQVKSFYVFGSAVTNDFDSNSDFDFLVRFKNSVDLLRYADNYFDLLQKLKDLLKRDVDLVSERSLKNPYLIDEINQAKIILYES